MAHGTLIGGAAYGIAGGKCLVGGTEYGIKKGRTLINGTGYDIEFTKKATVTLLDPPYGKRASIYANGTEIDWGSSAEVSVGDVLTVKNTQNKSARVLLNGTIIQEDLGRNETIDIGITGDTTIEDAGRTKANIRITMQST